ncbi:meiosis-specific transcription factor mei4 [Emericellopsis cladophorae]|uniref:Meiosis-specific transcription factor mei4 n=1 Tax=Emericellopsis cladophorae TaxID=2686198 RepID=A0A9Q0BI22_9HYPO|nr:meiosis-specific transcription factor mei4 [Emericellopsis cladophorae]KAI6785766.1 meiosis-specific transcription factor mei4 [Emericellopsis cladophorae]
MANRPLFRGADEPPKIFQDFDSFDSFDAVENTYSHTDGLDNFNATHGLNAFSNIHNAMTSHAPMPTTIAKPSRRALGAIDSNAVLKPTQSQQKAMSPHKMGNAARRSPLKTANAKKLNNVSMPPPGQRRQTDTIWKKPFLYEFKAPPHSENLPGVTDENSMPYGVFPSSATSSAPTPRPSSSSNGKRKLLDAAPIMDSRPAKWSKKADSELATSPAPSSSFDVLPPPSSFPVIVDDGQKPPLSYAQLIGTAILRSPNRRLTLNQIYTWISDTYTFYNIKETGWQNSIRHNLSLHKGFEKVERPKEDPGKGHYWMIVPGCESEFLRRKPARKGTQSAENLPVMSTRLEPSRPATAPALEPSLPPPVPQARQPARATEEPRLPSSDATIPESDGPTPEELSERPSVPNSSFRRPAQSPAPHGLHSSPPVARHNRTHSATSVPGQSSVTRPSKRGAPEDSGYISSLDSSAHRPSKWNSQWTAESGRPRRRARALGGSGRAEDAIRQIRNPLSSPHSPTRSRSKSVNQSLLSSPYKQNMNMMGPKTPVSKLAQMLPITKSVSPRANLLKHRKQIAAYTASPGRANNGLEEVPYSPEFSLEGTTAHAFDFTRDAIVNDDFLNTLDPYSTFFHVRGSGSPIKRSPLKRSPLKQSDLLPPMPASVLKLSDSTPRGCTSAPALQLNEQAFDFFDTPSKAFEGMSSPFKYLGGSLLEAFDETSPQDASPCKSKLAQPQLPAPKADDDAENWDGLGHQQVATGFPEEEGSDFDITQGFAQIG